MLKQFFFENYFLSFIRLNFHQVDENLYRSAQPLPHQLEKLIKKYNLKTVINLRGDENSNINKKEKAICDKFDVEFITLNLKSRAIPSKEQINQIYNTLKTIKYPALIHCKSGSDRTGLVATLYLYLIKNVALNKAMKQLNFIPYGHIKYSKAGKIDFFFESYLKENKDISLIEWVNNYMDREKLNKEFKNPTLFDFINDKLLKRE